MDRFSLRRAIERLRDGLFDPVAGERLTLGKDRIEAAFSQGLQAVEKGSAHPLAICGSYGEGKTHTLNYLNQRALSQGFATSIVQLDIREVPFHQFSTVYKVIMERLSLPDHQSFVQAWKNWKNPEAFKFLETMPHRFKIALIAMLSKTKPLTLKEGSLKKPRADRPKEYGSWLEKIVMGSHIPAKQLKSVCKYRGVEGYQEHPLICRGNEPYFQMIQSLGRILKEMGYKGLILFFDEAESITQGTLRHRAKSYQLLDSFFQAKGSVFPIFGFTDDFFAKLKSESYNDHQDMFPKNYAELWQDLNIVRLQEASSQEWNFLLHHLMQLYSEAYQVELSSQIKPALQALVEKLQVPQMRYKLKALVNRLDIETQGAWLLR